MDKNKNFSGKRMIFILVIFACIVIVALLYVVSLYTSHTSHGEKVHITSSDSGSTIPIKANQNITVDLNLDTALDHTVEIDNPNLLNQQIPLTNAAKNMYTTVLHAKKAGIVTVYVFGKPKCTPGEICPKFITRDFVVTFEITR